MQEKPTKSYGDYGITLERGSGPEIYCRCPKCEGDRRKKRRKPLGVNIEKGVWYCYHCYEGGSLLTGWNSDPEVVRHRRDYLRDIYLPPKPLTPAAAPERVKAEAEIERTRELPREYLEGVEGVRIVKTWCLFCEDWVTAVAFPYMKGGRHVHTKYRHTAEDGDRHLFTDNRTERCLYGYDVVVNGFANKPVVLVEGEYDALAVRFSDEDYQWRVASVPDGASGVNAAKKAQASRGQVLDASHVKMEWLNDPTLVQALYAAPYVVLAFDSDEDGVYLREEVARRIGWERCRVADWPSDCKDANDVLKRWGSSGVRDSVEAARPYPVEGLLRIRAAAERIDYLYEHGLPEGLSTGWKNLDPYIRFLEGQFIVVFGTTGSGKSHWVNQLGLHLASDWSTAICSPESGTLDQHGIALLENKVGKPFDRKKWGDAAMTRDDLEEAREWIQDHLTFLLPKDRSVENIVEKMRAAVIQNGSKLFIVDNWMSLHHKDAKDKLEYIERSLTLFQDFWGSTGSTGILVLHTTKPPGGKVAEMGLYGPAHSAGFPNRCDGEVEIIRDRDVPGYTKVAMQKVRNRWLGVEGSDILRFDRATGRYFVPTEFDRQTYDQLRAEAKARQKEPTPIRQGPWEKKKGRDTIPEPEEEAAAEPEYAETSFL